MKKLLLALLILFMVGACTSKSKEAVEDTKDTIEIVVKSKDTLKIVVDSAREDVDTIKSSGIKIVK